MPKSRAAACRSPCLDGYCDGVHRVDGKALMQRSSIYLAAALGLALAGSVQAQDLVGGITDQLRGLGFEQIDVKQTLLGRTRIVARSAEGQREIILNPNTGEILRDFWQAAPGQSATNRLVDSRNSGGSDRSGSTDSGRSGSGDGSDDSSGSDGGNDDNSGSGNSNDDRSGSDDRDDDSGSDDDNSDDSGDDSDDDGDDSDNSGGGSDDSSDD